MTSITTRAVKGSALTHAEVDANFTNLNTDKLDIAGIAAGTAASPTIKFTGDINTGLFSPGAGTLGFSTNGTERARIDSSGRLLVGTSSARLYTSLGYARFQVEGTSFADSSIGLTNNQATVDGPYLVLNKTRGTAIGSVTTVQSGDLLGSLWFQGSDGTSQIRGAVIEAVVDGTPGANDMTADGASSPTERMRIDSAGRILLNTPTAYSVSKFTADFNSASDFGLTLRDTGSSVDAVMMYFYKSGNVRGNITTNATSTAYNTSSDYRLKENITAVTGGISRLQQLKPSRFNFIEDPGKTVDGFIAHEVQAVVPEAITGEKDAEDADGTPIYQGIDQSKLVPLLTAALQEAIKRIEHLEARLSTLEAAGS